MSSSLSFSTCWPWKINFKKLASSLFIMIPGRIMCSFQGKYFQIQLCVIIFSITYDLISSSSCFWIYTLNQRFSSTNFSVIFSVGKFRLFSIFKFENLFILLTIRYYIEVLFANDLLG
jgi:hypothetical protein